MRTWLSDVDNGEFLDDDEKSSSESEIRKQKDDNVCLGGSSCERHKSSEDPIEEERCYTCMGSIT